MSNQTGDVKTTNYASRLLSKVMNERTKNNFRDDKLTIAEAAKYAVEKESKDLASVSKG